MSEFVATDQAVNLFVNGGFDEATPEGLEPIAWQILDARPRIPAVTGGAVDCVPNDIDSLATGSLFELLSEAQERPGHRNFLRFVVNTKQTVTLLYQTENLSSSMDLRRDGLEYARWWGAKSTIGLSLKVNDGGVRVTITLEDKQAVPVAIQSVDLGRSFNRNWVRLVANFDEVVAAGTGEPSRWKIEIEALDNRPAEVDMSAFQWIQGEYTEAPFTGDASYDFIPRETIVIVAGPNCPLGTRKLVESASEEILDRVLMAGATVLDLRGEEFHEHETENSIGHATRPAERGGGGNQWIPGNVFHTHTTSQAVNRPMTRAVTLCVKL